MVDILLFFNNGGNPKCFQGFVSGYAFKNIPNLKRDKVLYILQNMKLRSQ